VAARKGDNPPADSPDASDSLEESIVGIWKEGRMVDTMTTDFEIETQTERLPLKPIVTVPQNIKKLAVRDFDLA
jgi:hypothetical protein